MANDLELDCGGGVTLKLNMIPAGSFMMGSMIRSEEQPVHEVTIPMPFYMGVYPVTQAQYQAVIGVNPSEFSNGPDAPQRPVDSVSWWNADQFCCKLSKKTGLQVTLPSESQWEYACRAGSSTEYYYGEDDSLLKEYANYKVTPVYGNTQTAPVGSFKPNAFSLYDMLGNVWEWCKDNWHGDYHGAPTDGSAWMHEHKDMCHVLRSGSWHSCADTCRTTVRLREMVHAPMWAAQGFRVIVRSKKILSPGDELRCI